MNLPSKVLVTEVVGRDGFQSEPQFVPTEDKIRLLNLLIGAGLRRLQVTSFVHPRAVPQLRDAEEVVRGLERSGGVRIAALVPNVHGALKAIHSGADELHYFFSLSESHNRANVNRTIAESLYELERVAEVADAHGVAWVPSLATAFSCPFEGVTPRERLLEHVGRLVELGATEITLGDTIGSANPRQVYDAVTAIRTTWPEILINLHFHNTRGMGLANVLVALQLGVERLDASLGGLGGCPFAPGATGNISTEDLVHMLGEMGVETGIRLSELLEASKLLRRLVGHDLDSQMLRAHESSQYAARGGGLKCRADCLPPPVEDGSGR